MKDLVDFSGEIKDKNFGGHKVSWEGKGLDDDDDIDALGLDEGEDTGRR